MQALLSPSQLQQQARTCCVHPERSTTVNPCCPHGMYGICAKRRQPLPGAWNGLLAGPPACLAPQHQQGDAARSLVATHSAAVCAAAQAAPIPIVTAVAAKATAAALSAVAPISWQVASSERASPQHKGSPVHEPRLQHAPSDDCSPIITQQQQQQQQQQQTPPPAHQAVVANNAVPLSPGVTTTPASAPVTASAIQSLASFDGPQDSQAGFELGWAQDFHSKWRMQHVLGMGQYGVVWRAVRANSNAGTESSESGAGSGAEGDAAAAPAWATAPTTTRITTTTATTSAAAVTTSSAAAAQRLPLGPSVSASASSSSPPSSSSPSSELAAGVLSAAQFQHQHQQLAEARAEAEAELVAVKVLPKCRPGCTRAETLAKIQREVAVWSACQGSSHVARLIATYEDPHSVYLVQELCAGGDLQAATQNAALPEQHLVAVMRAVLEVLRECHANQMAYGDVKAANFVLKHPFSSSSSSSPSSSSSSSASSSSSSGGGSHPDSGSQPAAPAVAPLAASATTASPTAPSASSGGSCQDDQRDHHRDQDHQDQDDHRPDRDQDHQDQDAEPGLHASVSALQAAAQELCGSASSSSCDQCGEPQRPPRVELRAVDFGCSMPLAECARAKRRLGTPVYMAPEVWTQCFGPHSDIWSAGVLMFLLLTGRYPFWPCKREEVDAKMPAYQVMLAACSAPISFSGPEFRSVSREARELLARLLDRNPSTRISAPEALRHAWFARWGYDVSPAPSSSSSSPSASTSSSSSPSCPSAAASPSAASRARA